MRPLPTGLDDPSSWEHCNGKKNVCAIVFLLIYQKMMRVVTYVLLSKRKFFMITAKAEISSYLSDFAETTQSGRNIKRLDSWRSENQKAHVFAIFRSERVR
ncbi:hypothetical protein A3843_04735 [Pseudovibrio exalbescens]|uniref:Uncharacterized protein n=1 Tax=Pseudovibrio exalbescens TaxID=197461 RepID=A0A1U7JJZ9_9HYPH|nr:hypothetical protein A3843_04735 [Pseudovibrio exalbescens]